MTQFDVVGLGNAIMDALVQLPSDDVLTELGYARGQMTPVDDAQWQAAHDHVAIHGVELASGGSCANTIAAMGLMGASVSYAGRVGEDSLGTAYTASLQDACGHHALQTSSTHKTGKCLSLISADAERTMLTDLGASVTMEGLDPFDEEIRNAGILHVTGYLLLGEPMASRCMEAIAIANQEEICISIDVAPTAGRSVAMTLPSRMSTTLPPCTANAPPAELTHRPPLAPISSATAAEPGAAAIL